MKSLTRRKEMINWMWVAICLAMPLVMSLSCCHSRVKMQYIGPIGMYFELQRKDSTVVISFGEREDSIYRNYFETYESSDIGGSPFYLIVDNKSDTPMIKHIFFEPMGFYDIHIPDYPYSIVLNPLMVERKNDFYNHIRELPNIDIDSIPAMDYYLVKVWPAAYDRYLDYHIYGIGVVDDVDAYVASFVKTPDLTSYKDLQKMGMPLGFQDNMLKYGPPEDMKRFTLTDDIRKKMIGTGWLFIDTMDISKNKVLEIDKWNLDDQYTLSVIYRIGPVGEKIPVNGARYHNAMDRHKLRVYYQ